MTFAKRLYRLKQIFTRKHTFSWYDRCVRCDASSLWNDNETPRNYCHECGSRYIGFWRHVRVQLHGFVKGF